MGQVGAENLKFGYVSFLAGQKITCPVKEVLVHRKFNPAATVLFQNFTPQYHACWVFHRCGSLYFRAALDSSIFFLYTDPSAGNAERIIGH